VRREREIPLEQLPLKPVEESRRIYTVSEINALARDVLESSFYDVWVEGEVSNLRSPGSGHLYFSLKDASAQIAAVLFRSQAAQLRFRLEDGLKVLCRGRISLYETRGTFQINCQWMEPAGRGSLQLAFEQLKRRLAAEGLFDPSRKRPLPALPQRIGIITSPSGAALRDFLHVLDRRYANVRITIHPVRVQGDEAAPEIAEALRRMNRIGGFDVLVLCRGGGSLEDLWPFNEEVVARAVADSLIPVISAVGHEIDFTISDFAADLRAATPSAAAELVVASKEELQGRIASLDARLKSAARLRHHALRERVGRLGRSRALRSMSRRVDLLFQRLDDSRQGMREGLRRTLSERRRRLYRLQEAVVPRILSAGVETRRQQSLHLLRRAALAARGIGRERRERWRALSSLLDSLSPLSVLDRGYALCLDPGTGAPVTDTHRLPEAGRVEVRLRRGRIGCDIREVSHAQDEKER
jgi:exodeoxyribonuclease VII large subunit